MSDFSDFDPSDDDDYNINQREADDYRHEADEFWNQEYDDDWGDRT